MTTKQLPLRGAQLRGYKATVARPTLAAPTSSGPRRFHAPCSRDVTIDAGTKRHEPIDLLKIERADVATIVETRREDFNAYIARERAKIAARYLAR